MRSYQVYLESSVEGMCMAHVPGLPGCFARGDSRDEALERLPGAIAAYHSWLARHGEPAAEPGVSSADWGTEGLQLELRIVGESEGVGPFNPGDAAALLASDHRLVTPQEMERYFRLSTHSRSDLLALVSRLPSSILDWQPYPEWFSIRQVLRHVGNAEEWYVSRVVPPETLPSEWDRDEELPLFEFLEMERRTGFARLRQLTPQDRSRVCTPTAWTQHPEEAWTLRKVLRRFVEHEREHTSQVRQILDLYRRRLLASLAADEAALLEPLLGLDETILAREPVVGDQTARDVLAGLAAKDRLELCTMGVGAARQRVERLGERNVAGPEDAHLQVIPGPRAGLPEVLADLDSAAEAWRTWLEGVPEEALFRGGPWGCPVDAAMHRSDHLQEQAARLAAWRQALDQVPGAPSAAMVRAALRAGRQDLLASVALIPPEARDRPVCGTWTVQDVIGHVADWELLGLEGLRYMASGPGIEPVRVEHVDDLDAWNEAHVAARRGQSWEEAWADLQQAHRFLIAIVEGMDEAALARRFVFAWGEEGTPYEWLCEYLAHDREHAAGLRATLPIPSVYSSS